MNVDDTFNINWTMKWVWFKWAKPLNGLSQNLLITSMGNSCDVEPLILDASHLYFPSVSWVMSFKISFPLVTDSGVIGISLLPSTCQNITSLLVPCYLYKPSWRWWAVMENRQSLNRKKKWMSFLISMHFCQCCLKLRKET